MSQPHFDVETPLKYPQEPTGRWTKDDFERFMIWSTALGTSDVFIQNDDPICIDLHGRKKWVTTRPLSKSEVTDIVVHIYGSDAALGRLLAKDPIDPQFSIRVNREETLPFRVNVTACQVRFQTGFSITIRTISRKPPALEDMNFPAQLLQGFFPKEGLTAIAGPTGSGKTTLIAALIAHKMADPDANSCFRLYEHPIEYTFDTCPRPSSVFAHSQIGEHLTSWGEAVRNALRRAPQIISMGEMRDFETIAESIKASMTGHFVLGTVHAKSVANIPTRMVGVFPGAERASTLMDLSEAFQTLICQRLVPSLDGRRVPIREYLRFNEDLRKDLARVNTDKITDYMTDVVAACGQTFEQDLTRVLNQGLISEKVFLDHMESITGYRRATSLMGAQSTEAALEQFALELSSDRRL